MRVLAIIDPPHKLSPTADTTVALLSEVVRREHQAFVCHPSDLSLRDDEPRADVQAVSAVSRSAWPALQVDRERQTFPLPYFHAVLMRKDPPYDLAYHMATLILELARGRTLLVNDPRGLREANEKLYVLHFPDLMVPTLVTNSKDRLLAFLAEQGGQMIVKPLDGHGGSGVFLVQAGDRNTNAILETSTDEWRRWVMAQRYVPEARLGDKRVLLLDGEPLGAVLRVPRGDDTRGNLHVGGTAQKTELSARDLHICRRIGPRLRQDGLHFVGIDILGEYLTEVNVTSPTGMQEIDRLEGLSGSGALEAIVVNWMERKAPGAL